MRIGGERFGGRERISAVIACYRDAQAIPIMHERLTAVFTGLGVEHEIIFVNDGSPDDSRELLRELAARDPRVVVITHSRASARRAPSRAGCGSPPATLWSCSTVTSRIRPN